MFCAPKTANLLLNWGKKTRLAPVVESLVSDVHTTIFLSKISEKLPLSETPKCHLFWLLCQICASLVVTLINQPPCCCDLLLDLIGGIQCKKGRPFSVGRSSQGPAGVPRNREKLPISTPKNESNLTRYWDFCEKMWHLSHPRTAILLYELADPQDSRSKGRIAVSGWGKSHIFSKISQFLVKFDSFFGVESGNFLLRKSPQNICGFLKKNRNSEKI